MTTERDWFKHAEAAGFVFLYIPGMEKGTHVTGWTTPGARAKGKFPSADAALIWRDGGDVPGNLGVGSESGSRLRILDAADDRARDFVTGILEAEGVTTLSMDTPRGRAWLFRLPKGEDIPPLKEGEGEAGGLGVRAAGQYQVAPGSMVGPGAYGPNKPPPDDSGGPWHYRARDVVPVAVMPMALVQALRDVRAAPAKPQAAGTAGPQTRREGAGSGRQALGCRTLDLGVATLRDLVLNQGSGRNDAVYRVACSLIWHRALTRDNYREVEAALIDEQQALRAGEKRDVSREVPEQIDHAFAFIANQGGPGGRPDGEGMDAEPVPPVTDDYSGDFALLDAYRAAFRKAQAERAPGTVRQLREAEADVLASLARRAGAAGDEPDVTAGTLDAARAAFEAGGEAAVVKALREWEKRGIVSDPVDWQKSPGPRGWLVPYWLPAGRIGMVTGLGSAGKSRLTLQLAAVLASGRGVWLPSLEPDEVVQVAPLVSPEGEALPIPAVVATWEDEADELRRRLHGMKGVDVEAADVGEYLHHVDLSGAGALWAPSRSGSGHTATMGALTGAGRWLRRFCEEVNDGQGARLLVVDPLAAAYACSENDRGLVRHFMSDWDNWAKRTGCAVLIVSHPSKDSAGDKTFHQSGSTDWHGASRFVWRMESQKVGPAPKGKGEGGNPLPDDRPDVMRLDVTKSNYHVGALPGRWLKADGAGWRAQSEKQAAPAAGMKFPDGGRRTTDGTGIGF